MNNLKRTIFRLLLSSVLVISSVSFLSAMPKISLLTAGPTDEEVFFLYGHSGIRIQDPDNGYDYVFNYGYFSMNQPNFILNFILGKPLYFLGVTTMDMFLEDYGRGGRSVTEQVLNLRPEEARAFKDYLEWNARPENAQYQYNFFFDNCATRPRDLIEKFAGGLDYKTDPIKLPTFREAAREKSHTAQWYTFGADICLGSQSDEKMTVRDAAYLPDFLMQELDSATRTKDGQPIILSKTELLPQTLVLKDSGLYFPSIVFGILLLFVGLRYFFKPYRKTDLKILAAILFSVLGLLGITLWFLAFVSEHPHMFPNENMLLFHPFWFLLIPLLFRKKSSKRSLYQEILFWLFALSLGIFALMVLIPGGQSVPRGELLLWLCAVLLSIFAFYPDPSRITVGKPAA